MVYFRVLVNKFVSFKTYLILVLICVCFLLLYKPKINLKFLYTSDNIYPDFEFNDQNRHDNIIKLYYGKREEWPTSNLGSILFKNSPPDVADYEINQGKIFVVLIWKYLKWLENRHVYNFKSEREGDPLSNCSVKNCKFTGNDRRLSIADAVVIHVQRGVFPDTRKRHPKQRWVFLSDESPIHSFSMAKTAPKLSNLANIFNWSMTYRSDSDVPVPYGRTVPLKKPLLNGVTYKNLYTLVPYWNNKRRDILATILISNCGVSRRMDYLEQMQKHLKIDVYGKCSKDHKESCPGHFKADCSLISNYLFYLVFENSLCHEYLTEKLFYHAYSKGAIPVIMGSTVENCERLLPPNSFLHVDNYKSPEDLVKHMLNISKDKISILSYHEWRNDFDIVNEHGYFGSRSYHLCRICEALNYNDEEEKIYNEEDLRVFLDPDLSCR